MSKKAQRREAERLARRAAYLQSRPAAPVTAPTPDTFEASQPFAAAAPAQDNTEALPDLLCTCEEDHLDHPEPEIGAVRARTGMEQSQTMSETPGTDPSHRGEPDRIAELIESLEENVRAAEAFPPDVRDHIEAKSPGFFAQAEARKTMAANLRAGRPATEAQINANRENAQKSTGATTPEGKATVSQNRRTHGLAGNFHILPWENAEDFRSLAHSIYEEHKPATATEQRLVDSMIQHYWLKQRAIGLQEELLLTSQNPTEVDGKKLALFLRYQTTHERSYYKAEKELQNLKKTKQKEEIGFESQKQKAEAHEAKVRLDNARAMNLEIDTAARQVMEAPIPGNFRISFEELTHACSTAISLTVTQKQQAAEANNG